MDNIKLVSSVESVLGKGRKTSNGNVAYHCPFCNHHKRKLEVQMITNTKGENPWNCWVCQKKGKKLVNLYKQLNTGYDKIVELNKALGVVTKDINSLFAEYSRESPSHCHYSKLFYACFQTFPTHAKFWHD